jgi:hypothetical protein
MDNLETIATKLKQYDAGIYKLFTFEETCAVLGIGKTLLQELINDPDCKLKARRMGAKRVFYIKDVLAFRDGLPVATKENGTHRNPLGPRAASPWRRHGDVETAIEKLILAAADVFEMEASFRLGSGERTVSENKSVALAAE